MDDLNLPIKDHQRYEGNPYLQETFEQMEKTKVKSRGIRGGLNRAGIEYDSVTHERTILVDSDQFVKIYVHEMRELFNLKPSTIRVFLHMIEIISEQTKGERIQLQPAAWWAQNLSISSSAYWTAIKELLNKGFIARTIADNIYYFNPRMVFNGDRASFITTYVRQQKAAEAKAA